MAISGGHQCDGLCQVLSTNKEHVLRQEVLPFVKWTAYRLQRPYFRSEGLHRPRTLSFRFGGVLPLLDVRPDPDVEIRLVPARIGTGLLAPLGGAVCGCYSGD